jgi:hypothetical protein
MLIAELKALLKTIKLQGLRRCKHYLYAKDLNGKFKRSYSVREYVWTFCQNPSLANQLIPMFEQKVPCAKKQQEKGTKEKCKNEKKKRSKRKRRHNKRKRKL